MLYFESPGEGVKLSQATSENPPRRVLVVDDELLIRWSIKETLVQAGYTVTEAGNAKEALHAIEAAQSPKVILLDFRLPDSTDLRLLDTIRRRLPHTAVILMTAYGTSEVVSGALGLGAFRVIGKPIEMRDLPPLVELAYESILH